MSLDIGQFRPEDEILFTDTDTDTYYGADEYGDYLIFVFRNDSVPLHGGFKCFRSREEVDDFVQWLEKHRDERWPLSRELL